MRTSASSLALLFILLAATASAAAETRELVTLRSGFQITAEQTEIRDGHLFLHADGGEIRIAINEVVSIAPVVSASEEPAVPSQSDAEPARPSPVSVPELIRAAAQRQGLPEAFVRSVAEAESALRPDAVSPKGARGVMQLMPGTAAELGVNAHDPAENIEGGARLLRTLLLRYQNEPDQVRRALAAYNAGQGAVEKYRGVPPYRETQQYIERVLRRYQVNQLPTTER